MNSGLKLSNREVWAAIAYLDPEFDDDSVRRIELHERLQLTRLKASIVVASLGALLYAAALRYLPAVARFFN